MEAEPGPRIEPITAAHLDGVAQCHVTCFPHQAVSHVGWRFVAETYRGYVEAPRALGRVAVTEKNQVVGLIVGGDWRIRRRYLRRARRKFLLPILGKALVDATVRAGLLWHLLPWRQEAIPIPVEVKEGLRVADLRFLCVDPRYQGRGLARRLMEAFEQACREAGWEGMYLCVDLDNVPAIALYRTGGWSEAFRTLKQIHMRKGLGPAGARPEGRG